jgi:GxxExxY protein
LDKLENIASAAIDCGFKLHEAIGPGLLESVYEVLLARSLEQAGFKVERQKPIPIKFNGVAFEQGFRADLIVESKLIIEVKSVERIAPVHGKQLLTYLRLMDLPLGLLMNFGEELFRTGVRRVANNYYGNWQSKERP